MKTVIYISALLISLCINEELVFELGTPLIMIAFSFLMWDIGEIYEHYKTKD